jgi:hypothetical protein
VYLRREAPVLFPVLFPIPDRRSLNRAEYDGLTADFG